MAVLIVSKTRMGSGRVCVGGFDVENRRNVRLLTQQGANQVASTPFEIGQLWEMTYQRKSNCVAPHVEDVLVQRCRQLGKQDNLAQFIGDNAPVVRGSLSNAFEGSVQFTAAGSPFVAKSGKVPANSVAFWESDVPLTRDDFNAKVRYALQEGAHTRHISFVGLQPALKSIPAGMLLRLSMARWWRPPDAAESEEKKCYLQLSGYYE